MSQGQSNNCDTGQTLISLEQALLELKSYANPIEESEQVLLKESLGRVLAEDVISTIKVPPLDNSAMDGYAIRASDVSQVNDSQLEVSQRICAGQIGDNLQANTVARIFTGAPIPEGADTVVMQEHCEFNPETNKILFKKDVKKGKNIRRAGEDIQAGDIVLKKGQKLRPQDIGLAASIGIAKLSVKKPLKVAVFFTGDELCDPEDTPKVGQIFNSNRYTLYSLLDALGCEVIDLGNIEDSLDATIKAMQKAASNADLVMTSGGVSVGEEDHVRKAIETIGQLKMWRVNIKPGKPFAFGQIKSAEKEIPFIGLPGNPVSVFTTFCIFAHPFILQTQGNSQSQVHSFKVASSFELDAHESRNEFMRVRLEKNDAGESTLSVYPHQGSGVLSSTSWANGFAFIPANTSVKQGDLLDFTPFSEYSIA